jgi:hypothetical protein
VWTKFTYDYMNRVYLKDNFDIMVKWNLGVTRFFLGGSRKTKIQISELLKLNIKLVVYEFLTFSLSLSLWSISLSLNNEKIDQKLKIWQKKYKI